MMKSIFIAYGMIVTSFVLFLSLGWYIQFDHTHYVSEMALKRALLSTMSEYATQQNVDAQDVFSSFKAYFKELAMEGYDYELTMSGFIQEPLFMRMHCVVSNDSKLKGLHITLDEAMIEELSE